MVITKGKKATPLRCIIYGPPGIGKSTLAGQFPNPLFVDIEDGTGELDVSRTQKPTSWPMLKGIVTEMTKDAQGFKTLVLDSADWADGLAINDICAKANKTGIEDFGFGKGWQYLADEWKRFLDLLSDLQEKQGMNVVFVAHSGIKKFTLPDETGSYDRYELKMERKSADILKEWASAILFANYQTLVVEIDKKKKAQGGKRVMYSNFHPCWDAKNRYGMGDELEMSMKSLSLMFAAIPAAKAEPKTEAKPEPKKETAVEKAVAVATIEPEKPIATKPVDGGRPDGIPDALWDLMVMGGVTGPQIQAAVAKRGHYPIDTPIKNYDEKFMNGCLIAAFDKVKEIIATL